MSPNTNKCVYVVRFFVFTFFVCNYLFPAPYIGSYDYTAASSNYLAFDFYLQFFYDAM